MPVIKRSALRWVVAFVIALIFHAGLIVWAGATAQPPALSAKQQGRAGIEVGIAQLLPAPKPAPPKVIPAPKPAPQAPSKPLKRPLKKSVPKPQVVQSDTLLKQALPQPEPLPEPLPEPSSVEPPVIESASKPPPEPVAQSAQPAREGGAAVQAQRVSYHAQVMAHLLKYKHYPSRAKRRRMQGVLAVEVSVGRNGELLNYTIVKSSEHQVLDQAAIDMLKRAEPLPVIPAQMLDSVYTGVFSIGYAVR